MAAVAPWELESRFANTAFCEHQAPSQQRNTGLSPVAGSIRRLPAIVPRCQQEVIEVTDILIRAVPGAVIDEIDRQARGLGVSRSEFLRRRLDREFRPVGKLTTADLVRLAELIRDTPAPDLTEPEVADPEIVEGTRA